MGFPITSAGGFSKLLTLTLSIAISVLRESFVSLILHSPECSQEEHDDAGEEEYRENEPEWTFRPEIEASFYASLEGRYLQDDEEEGEEERRKSSLDSLPSCYFSGDAGYSDDLQCAVCLCEFCDGQVVRDLPTCGHVFHKNCIDAWLLRSHCTCPLCRAPLSEMIANPQVQS